MNGFTKKRIKTLTLGEKLKKLRSDKRISLNEVSRATKIQINYLEALEDGSYKKLPADVYAKGFLRSYGDFLGVDEKILLRLYEKEKEIGKNLDKKTQKKEKEKPVNVSSFIFTPQKILFIAIGIFVFLGLFFLYREINSFSSAPSLVILSPLNDFETEDNSVYIEGSTERDANLFINGQQVLVSDEGKFRENLSLQSGINLIGVKAVNRFGKEVERNITIKSNFNSEKKEEKNDSPESQSEAEQAEKKELAMDLWVEPGPVWLNIEADEVVVFSGNMFSGAIQTIKAREKIKLSSGKGNATFIRLNGKDLGAVSENQEAIKDKIFQLEEVINN